MHNIYKTLKTTKSNLILFNIKNYLMQVTTKLNTELDRPEKFLFLEL